MSGLELYENPYNGRETHFESDRPVSTDTVIVKSGSQSYGGIFFNVFVEDENCCVREESVRSSYIGSTNLSIGSPKEGGGIEFKDLSKTFYASILEQPQESERDEELSQLFCDECGRYTFPVISLQLKTLGLISSFKYLFDNLRCCSSGIDLKDYHEYAYSCSLCSKILLKRPVIY